MKICTPFRPGGPRQRQSMRCQGLLLFLLSFLLIYNNNAHAQSDGLPRGHTQLPYTRYEAENASRGGGASLQSSPQFIQTDIASEASDQQYVSLLSNGSYVEWTLSQAAQGLNLRFTMPDNNTGTGLTGSLTLQVNGNTVRTINLSSYWAYQYFPHPDPEQTPGGKTFMRFDEVHFRLASALNSGDRVRIVKDNGDNITYGIDFIEMESVPAALTIPANYLNVEAYGANGADQNDDFAAFNQCIAAASSQGKHVYIPPGRFLLSDKLMLNASNIKIMGAGVWYTEVYFSTDKQFYGGFMGRCSNVEISHFSLNTINNDRLKYNESNPRVPAEMYKIYKGFMGTYGNGSRIHDIWVEHFECGFWIGGYDPPYPIDITNDLIISKCRIRNNYADGVNFCQGTSNSVVEQSSVRNNGDDGLACWPANAAGNNQTCRNNIFRNNTIENNWRAGSIALFGGTGHQVHHNLIKDGVAGSAIRATNDFPGFTFEYPGDVIRIYENTINGCGTSYDLWNQKRGAIELFANTGIFNFQFDNNTILRSQRDAIQFQGNNIHHMVFNNTIIDGTGLDPVVRDVPADVYGGFGLYVAAGSQTATFNNLTVTNAESGAYMNRNQSFNLIIQNISIPVTGVSITPAGALSLTEGQTATLTAVITPVDATNKNVTWSSSNTAVATVDATGKVTAAGLGTATITVRTQDGNFTATRQVTVSAAVNVLATDAAAGEGGNTGSFTISTAVVTQNITVNYAISGTASAADYTASPALSGTVTLTPSSRSVVITITPADDQNFEGAENLRLTLKPGTGYSLGGDTIAVINIADNDNPPCIAPVVAQISGSAPVIDQSIEAVWATAPVKTITSVTIGGMPGDYSGKWRALYNATHLYLLVEVNDANKFFDSGGNWWEDDVIEVFIDGDNSKTATYDGANDFQLGFRWNDNTIRVGGNSVTNTTGIQFLVYNTGSGYNLEVAIPWSTIGTTAAPGKAIGLDVQVDDDDNGGTRDAQIASFATTTTAWSDPRVFGTVYLTTCSGSGNQPPVANAGTDRTLAAGTTSVTLNGSGSDPDGTAVTYAWTKVSGPAVTFSSTAVAAPVVSGLTNGSTYVFRLTVSDGSLTASDEVQITVSPSGPVPGTIRVPRTTAAITVNGSLSEAAWDLSQTVSKSVTGSPNNTVTFGVLWDANNLYIGVRVLDDALHNDSPDPWENDAVEVYIDANNNKLTTYDNRDNQFIKMYNSSSLFARVAVTGVQHAWASIPGGYSVELSIPWSQLGLTPVTGLAVGFDVGYDDDDNGGPRDGQAVWNGTINNYQNTSGFGTIILEDAGMRMAAPVSEVLLTDEKVVGKGVSSITLAPNPAVNGRTTLIIPSQTAPVLLRVLDVNGRVVYAGKVQQTAVLNLESLSKGLYTVQVVMGSKTVNKKLLVE